MCTQLLYISWRFKLRSTRWSSAANIVLAHCPMHRQQGKHLIGGVVQCLLHFICIVTPQLLLDTKPSRNLQNLWRNRIYCEIRVHQFCSCSGIGTCIYIKQQETNIGGRESLDDGYASNIQAFTFNQVSKDINRNPVYIVQHHPSETLHTPIWMLTKINDASKMHGDVTHPSTVVVIMHVSRRGIWGCWGCCAERMLGIQKDLLQLTHQHTNTACSQRGEIDSHPPQTSTQSHNMTFDSSFSIWLVISILSKVILNTNMIGITQSDY